MGRKIIRFGGPGLQEPQWVPFDSAITGGILHGHPGDEVPVITQTEATMIRQELYAGLHGPPASWTADQMRIYGAFAGKKAILDTEVHRFIKRLGDRGQRLPEIVEILDAPAGFDLRAHFGLAPEEPEPSPAPAKRRSREVSEK